MSSFWAALRFLTIFPIPGTWGSSDAALAKSPAWFPGVGFLLGVLAAGSVRFVQPYLPFPLLCALVVIGLLAVSGGLHMDGLADTADGFLSSRPKEKILEIMKDSRVGAMGVLAMLCVLLLKFSALLSLPQQSLWKAVLLLPMAGRSAMLLHMALLPYVRSQGLGTIFSQHKPAAAAVGSTLLLLLAGWLLLGLPGLAASGGSMLLALILAAYIFHKIQGATGDTYGAACELAEMTMAVLLAIGPWQAGT